MARLILLLMVFSLGGCAVARPDTDLCVVNALASHRKCYNLKTDYDENGKLKSTATPKYRVNSTVEDLNKATLIDSDTGFEDGLSRLKTYIKNLRDEAKNCGK